MRFGLIGYGAWGRHHAAAIEKVPGARVTAIACRTEASAAAARRDFPSAAVELDYRRILDRADVDAVDVVVPNHLHAEIGVAALERGKDVLLEKPMAATLADCDRLIVAARASGRALSIGHELRLSKQWGRIKTLVDAGDVGEPRYAHVSLFRFPYRPGAGGWRHEPDRVGSWVLEELVHHFDLLMWYFERWGEPVSVLSLGNARDGGDPRMADNFSSVLRFSAPLYAVVTKTVAAFEYHLALEVVGTEGAIRAWWSGSMDRTRHATFELKRGPRGGEPETLRVEESGELFELEEELRRTVAAFKERRPLVSGEEARKRVLVCLEAERSLREGREIALG